MPKMTINGKTNMLGKILLCTFFLETRKHFLEMSEAIGYCLVWFGIPICTSHGQLGDE